MEANKGRGEKNNVSYTSILIRDASRQLQALATLLPTNVRGTHMAGGSVGAPAVPDVVTRREVLYPARNRSAPQPKGTHFEN
jgi:hypothetical protein